MRSTRSRCRTCARGAWIRIQASWTRSQSSSGGCATPGRRSPMLTDRTEGPYQQLAALMELELQLVAERRFDELLDLKRRRAELQASLAGTPPGTAGPGLEGRG